MIDLIHGARRRARRLWYYQRIKRAVAGKRGLEIGGPSAAFSPARLNGFVPPIYTLAASMDNCNFSSNTLWSSCEAGRTFHFRPDAEPGMQFIHDASDMSSIADCSYDFLVASHILEHVANPLAALVEFRRVLKPKGAILILVPNRELTFDHRRPFTTMAHLEEDWLAKRDESDLTHLDEILALHDMSMDVAIDTLDEFRERSLRNFENRCLHHHVFSLGVLEEAFHRTQLRPAYSLDRWENHLLIFGYKA